MRFVTGGILGMMAFVSWTIALGDGVGSVGRGRCVIGLRGL